jgi:hypothetical protein
MSRSVSARPPRLAPILLAAAVGLGSLPAYAQTATTSASPVTCPGIRFDLSNPSAGAMLNPGGLMIEGVAQDNRAANGAGIDRVDFFLGSRELGGQSLGTVVPDTSGGPFGPGSFETTLQLPNIRGGSDLVAYAHSDVTGQESVISVPVVIGENPTVAGVTTVNGSTSPSISESCMGPAGAATSGMTTSGMSSTSSAPSSTTTTAMPAPAMAGASNITLQVGNPSNGDSVKIGSYVMQGEAWDAAASSGSGVDRIDIFLDDREAGGTRLGGATVGTAANPRGWTATIDFPNLLGGHTLFVYGHSSLTDHESVVQIPITIVQ